MGLFSYKMTHDSGFAPNPFGGVLKSLYWTVSIIPRQRNGFASC
jgi:hypothetical protein